MQRGKPKGQGVALAPCTRDALERRRINPGLNPEQTDIRSFAEQATHGLQQGFGQTLAIAASRHCFDALEQIQHVALFRLVEKSAQSAGLLG